MNTRFLAFGFLMSVLPLLGWSADDVKIMYGSNDPVCREAAMIARGIPAADFWSGSWRTGFGEIAWRQDSYPTVTAEGTPWNVEFQYLPIDIDNDGTEEVIIKETALFTSIDWDWLYIFRLQQFHVAQQEKSVGKLLQSVPKLNPQNTVQFTNGDTAVPVELHIWRREKSSLLVLKEHFFAKKQRGVPNALLIGRLGKQSVKYDAGTNTQRLVPDMVCRIVRM